jgi:hypothetical protein
MCQNGALTELFAARMRQIGAMTELFAAVPELFAAMAERFAAMAGFFGGIFPRPRRDVHGGWVARRPAR